MFSAYLTPRYRFARRPDPCAQQPDPPVRAGLHVVVFRGLLRVHRLQGDFSRSRANTFVDGRSIGQRIGQRYREAARAAAHTHHRHRGDEHCGNRPCGQNESHHDLHPCIEPKSSEWSDPEAGYLKIAACHQVNATGCAAHAVALYAGNGSIPVLLLLAMCVPWARAAGTADSPSDHGVPLFSGCRRRDPPRVRAGQVRRRPTDRRGRSLRVAHSRGCGRRSSKSRVDGEQCLPFIDV